MSAASATYAGRRAAERRMLDTFDIKQATGGYVYDPAANGGTGGDVQEFTLLFSTGGRVKDMTLIRDGEGGGRTVSTSQRELHIPVDSPAVPAGAVAFVTSVHPSSDPTLTGAQLHIEGQGPGSQTTARRLEVTETIS